MQRLYVHPQALAQCRVWVQRNLPRAEILETSSNARSAELASEARGAGTGGRRGARTGAITGTLAAEKYGLKIIVDNIQDFTGNATRFLVLGRQCSPPSGHDRTSLMFSIADEVGALYKALAPFRQYRLNMTKIESRPSKRKAWEYFFFVDCDGHMNDRKVARAIESLSSVCNFAKVLGSYPDGE
jgi:chorismate mutase/prephenate dehydratase